MLLYKVEYLDEEEYRKGLMLSMAADCGYPVSAYVDPIDWPCLPSDWTARDKDYDDLMTAHTVNESLSAQIVEWLNDTNDSHVVNLRASAGLEGVLSPDLFVGVKMFDFFEALASAKFPDTVTEALKENVLTEGEVDMTAPTDKIIEQIKENETVMKEINDGVKKLGGKRRIKLVATYNGQY